MLQDPLSIVQRWLEEVWNQRRVETIYELFTPETLIHSEEGTMRGPDEFRRLQYEPFTNAFPDLWLRLEDTLVEGEQVVVRWEASGTHTGAGLGFPPTCRQVEVNGMSWIRVEGGKIVQGWQQTSISETFYALKASAALNPAGGFGSSSIPIPAQTPLPIPTASLISSDKADSQPIPPQELK